MNIIFLHIPKNGGTTLIPILSKQFKEEEIFRLNVTDYKHVNYQEFLDLNDAEKAKIKLLTGHMHFGLHAHLKGETKYVTFLRYPVDRLLSYYYFVKRTPGHENYDRIFKNGWSFKDFVENSVELGVSNIQMELISGIKDNPEVMLNKAKENLANHFSFVGLQEYYDESLIGLQSQLKFEIPYYKPRNRTVNKPKPEFLDEETLNLIKTINKEDILFYEYGKETFKKQIESIPFFKFKLKRLHVVNRIHNSTKVKIIKRKLRM